VTLPVDTASTVLAQARAELLAGRAREALAGLSRVWTEPSLEASLAERAGALVLLTEAVARIPGAAPVAAAARAAVGAAEAPGAARAQALRALALELAKSDARRLAAALLAEAHAAAPDDVAVALDRVGVLELCGDNTTAREVLRQLPAAARTTFPVRYFSVFHAIMCGDLEAARVELPGLLRVAGDRQALASALEAMLARADAARGVTPLDGQDLRGWQLVLDGALLLDVGGELGGRHAIVHDTPPSLARAAAGVLAVLHAVERRPQAVLVVSDPASAVLARHVAAQLDVPCTAWSPRARGLVVVDDAERLDLDTARGLAQHHGGQTLWIHASCWLRPCPFAADLVTYQYARRQVAPSVAEAPDVLPDVAQVASLALAVRALPEGQAAGLFRTRGARWAQRYGSPVRLPAWP
jgi:hypothetical protein